MLRSIAAGIDIVNDRMPLIAAVAVNTTLRVDARFWDMLPLALFDTMVALT